MLTYLAFHVRVNELFIQLLFKDLLSEGTERYDGSAIFFFTICGTSSEMNLLLNLSVCFAVEKRDR
jgi:hypothetical protein